MDTTFKLDSALNLDCDKKKLTQHRFLTQNECGLLNLHLFLLLNINPLKKKYLKKFSF